MRENLEKYDKLITAFLVIIAFIFGIGWWFAEEKSEPAYLSKIDRLMFDKDNKAPKFVLTLPDKLVAKSRNEIKEIFVDAVTEEKTFLPNVEEDMFSVTDLLAEIPNIFKLPNKNPTYELENIYIDEKLVEKQKGLFLPKISEDGRKPWIEYGKSIKIQPNFKKIAIVIAGLGLDPKTSNKIAKVFDSEISMSFSPYAPNYTEIVNVARENAHETYVDLLLSSKDFLKEDSGPMSITPNLTNEASVDRFNRTIAVPHPIGGIIIRDGIADDSNKKILEILLLEAKNRGLLIVDATNSSTVENTDIKGLARKKADIVINRDTHKDNLEDLFKKAENIAFDRGQVLIVADPKPVIIIALYKWIASFSPQVSYEEARNIDITKPFALVPVSNLVVE